MRQKKCKQRFHCRGSRVLFLIDLFTDTAAILISIVSNSHYGMPRGQIHINLPPWHPIMSLETIEIKMATVSVKRSIIVTPGSYLEVSQIEIVVSSILKYYIDLEQVIFLFL